MHSAFLCLISLPLQQTFGFVHNQERSSLGDPLPCGSHGEAQLPLYPDGSVPGKKIESIPPESFSRADPNNPVGKMCSPTGVPAGNYYYNVETPALVPYLVNSSDPKFVDAAVVVAPGGGHDHLAFHVTGLDFAEWFNSLGISVFVLKYRVPAAAWQEGPVVAEMDGQRALSLVRQRAAEFGINPKKVGLMGSSAGGDLAVRLATAEGRAYSRIDEVDDVPYAPDFMVLLYPGIHSIDGARRAPPTFLSVAVDDPCAPAHKTIEYYNAMKKASSGPAELHVWPEGKHGYGVCTRYPGWEKKAACKWKESAIGFLSRQIGLPGWTNSSFAQDTPKCFKKPGMTGCLSLFGRSPCIGHCDLDCWSSCKAF